MFETNDQNTPKVEKETASTYIRVRWFLIRFAMVIFDIVAVNAAYFFALVMRFYVASEFNRYAEWCIPAFQSFAPYYTVCCIVVFVCFRLYSGMWKYAGINDMNQIIEANLVTVVIQVGGTLLFIGRMPFTYYVLGALIQFLLIAGSRFSYRLIAAEKIATLRGRRGTTLNVMIVGVGETARIVRKRIDSDHTNAANPVCMFTNSNENSNLRMDGIPVVSGMDKLKEHIKKYGVECVILADSMMTAQARKEIKTICEEVDVGIQDFSGYFQNEGSDLTLMQLMQYTSGPVEIRVNGISQVFPTGEQAAMTVEGKFDVRSISTHEGRIVVELTKHMTVLNNLNESWVQEFEQETGENISFF